MNLEKSLQRLISTSLDSEKRYHHAALDVGKEYLARFFDHQSAIRKQHATELRAERARLGIKGNGSSASIAGTLDTAAMDFNVVMSMGDTGVVDWCRKDAEAVAKEYQQELAQNPPAPLRALLERQAGEILATAADLEEVLREYGGPRS